MENERGTKIRKRYTGRGINVFLPSARGISVLFAPGTPLSVKESSVQVPDELLQRAYSGALAERMNAQRRFIAFVTRVFLGNI